MVDVKDAPQPDDADVPRPDSAAMSGERASTAGQGGWTSTVRRIWYGPSKNPPTYQIACSLFLRLLGVIYLIAFCSLWAQIEALIGNDGILPVSQFLDAVNGYYSGLDPAASPVWHVPTLLWLNSSDACLHILCASGVVLSLLVLCGILQKLSFALLWVIYLSLFHGGQDFLGFQWDVLLMEAGFLSIFVAPKRVFARLFVEEEPPRMAIWLVWWLLFRLMFQSGLTKLNWNDGVLGPDGLPIPNSWETLTALDSHYWTQPLPIWTSWYVAKLPAWFHRLSVLGVLGIELVLPWFIFGPRALRHLAFAGFTFLMLLIAGTGNYNFFNALTIVLGLLLIDDRAWPALLQRRLTATDSLAAAANPRTNFTVVGLALVLVLLSISKPNRSAQPGTTWTLHQFHLANDYGLFRRMTETRPEIVIEGTADGTHWLPYDFRWKPGNPSRRPGICMPHQPRLDWQMWFEALNLERTLSHRNAFHDGDLSGWFRSLLEHLLRGDQETLSLFGTVPFSEEQPQSIRVLLYQYRFTTREEMRATGDWWHRDLVGQSRPLTMP